MVKMEIKKKGQLEKYFAYATMDKEGLRLNFIPYILFKVIGLKKLEVKIE
jgi:hypothetical protein